MTMSNAVRPFLFALALALAPAIVQAQTETFVPVGASYRYLDNGSDQGSAWRSLAYDDAWWSVGQAELGYGDGDEVTVVDDGPSFFRHITTYFRHRFTVDDPGEWSGLLLRVLRDDGVVVYLNGTEVVRDNLPELIDIDEDTPAIENVDGADEGVWLPYALSAALLVPGENLLAVEIHQSSPFSSDISFDAELIGTVGAQVTRGPYLQRGGHDEVTIRWRTDVPTTSVVRYGFAPGGLPSSASDDAFTTEHIVRLQGLAADTRYHYAVGHGPHILAGGDAAHAFETAPMPGTRSPTRIWVLGDSGTADANAALVRDAYYGFTAGRHTDLWLMLGDNAYESGTDSEYQAAVFDMYPDMLRKSVLWPTRGNHEIFGNVYYGIFTLPRQGEIGGMPSGTEAYYSFDHANVHFICLDSFLSDPFVDGPMWTWLQNDLAATDQDWIVAFWHHPPYSKGSHDSDTELGLIKMRVNFLPLLEAGGVDLVLSGHSHGYERSYLIDGHYGFSFELDGSMILDGGDGRVAGQGAYRKEPVPNAGAVYCVAGSSGKATSGSYDHPAMFHSISTLGSLVIDVEGRAMDVTFLDAQGAVEDSFRLEKAIGGGPGPAGRATDPGAGGERELGER